jgi:hypothetical protein
VTLPSATATTTTATAQVIAAYLHNPLHSVSGWLCLLALPLLAIGVYAERCTNMPFRKCGKCRGLGRFPHATAWKRCRRCKGTGLRLRLGRRVFNALYRTYAEANH